jgi:hypothetical protein
MEKIKEFVTVISGSGSGYGSGYGSGSGDGYGSGYGSGYGDGVGSGYGDGDGDGVKSIDGKDVYRIDGVPTIITQLRNNIAKGFIINKDLTLDDCYLVKHGNMFAHGQTLRQAQEALRDKLFDDMDEDERIEAFMDEFELNMKYPAKLFFDWHNRLTGSCEMGRLNFAKNKGIDLDNDLYTVQEFIDICKDDYGSEIINNLANKYKEGK